MASPDDSEFVHGVTAIAAVIGASERQTRQLLEKRRLHGSFKLNWKWSLHLPTFRADVERRIRDGGKAA